MIRILFVGTEAYERAPHLDLPKPKPRRRRKPPSGKLIVAYVVRRGDVPGQGEYLYSEFSRDGDSYVVWSDSVSDCHRWTPASRDCAEESARDIGLYGYDDYDDSPFGRVVAIVSNKSTNKGKP